MALLAQRSWSRSIEDTFQAALGRTPLRYAFEVVPQLVTGLELPPGAASVSIVWERGASLCFTDPADVDECGCARFAQVMRQTATIYREEASDSLLAKPYTFKVQAASLTADSRHRSHTVARARLDLAQFAGASANAHDVEVQLHPQGSLRLSVRAVWLQHFDDQRRQHAQTGGRGALTSWSSDADSATDFSSIESSGSSDGSPRIADGDATPRRRDGCCSDLEALLEEARTRRPAPHAAVPGSLQSPEPRSAIGGLQPGMAGCRGSSSCAGAGFGRQRHRCASSVPETPTILEGEREGSSADLAPSTPPSAAPLAGCSVRCQQQQFQQPRPQQFQQQLQQPQQQQQQFQQPLRQRFLQPPTQLQQQPQLQRSQRRQPSHASVCSLELEAGAPHDESGQLAFAQQQRAQTSSSRPDDGQRSGRLSPSRLAVCGHTTDQLMAAISCSQDAAALRQLCRGLLLERNEWHHAATQAQRDASALQQQLGAARADEAVLRGDLAAAHAQLEQLQADALLDRLVEAKLALAQADLHNTTLRGQLTKERCRLRAVVARLTALQSSYDSLVDAQAAGEHGLCRGC